jgi:enamine deaminase RidA (YjgF/YER057c/UK114 family)
LVRWPLPCRLGIAASFDYTGFNGRALADDVMDVMLFPRAHWALGDGVGPDLARIHADFPYCDFGQTAWGKDWADDRRRVVRRGDCPPERALRRCGPGTCRHDQILVSGTPGLAPDGSLPGDMTGQAIQAWQNIQATLSQAGASLSDIVSVRQWLTSAKDVRAYVEVRGKFITHKPAFMLGVIPGLVRPETWGGNPPAGQAFLLLGNEQGALMGDEEDVR